MRWFRLVFEFEDLEYLSHHTFHLNKMDFDATSYNFREGMAIEKWDPNTRLQITDEEYDNGPMTDNMVACESIDLFSARLQRALSREGIRDLQYLPVKVFHRDGRLVRGYAIVNYLCVLAALDREKSRYSMSRRPDRKDQISVISHIAVRKKDIEDHDIVVLKENDLHIIASDRFRQAIRRWQFQGFIFMDEVELT